jgi:hypothetical protein
LPLSWTLKGLSNFQATTPEYRAYQEQVMSNCAKFAQVCVQILLGFFFFYLQYGLIFLYFTTLNNDFVLHLVHLSMLRIANYWFFNMMNCALTFEPLPYLVAIYHFQSLTAKGYELVSGGTDNHLVLVNLKSKVRQTCGTLWVF